MSRPNAIARELSELGKSDSRLIDRLDAVAKALEDNRARRCELLQEAAGLAHDAGQIDGDVSAEVVEPKDKK